MEIKCIAPLLGSVVAKVAACNVIKLCLLVLAHECTKLNVNMKV